MKKKTLFRGFTLVEFILAMAVFGILVGLITINLNYSQQRASINTTVTTLISDIKEQQLKAMVGDTEGRASPDTYGVYFQAHQYTLFHGASYVVNDPGNFVVGVDQTLQFAPINKTLLFSKLSGLVSGYSGNANTVVMTNTTTNEQKTVQYNQFGVIGSVN